MAPSKSIASKKRCHSDVDTISEPSGSLSACRGGALFFFNFLIFFFDLVGPQSDVDRPGKSINMTRQREAVTMRRRCLYSCLYSSMSTCAYTRYTLYVLLN
jgi:hypothetical protein